MARILIVDDDRLGLDLLTRLLGGMGYTVDDASTGEEALDKAFSSPPDCILLDIVLPGMDGFEVCRRLKSYPSTRAVPVILITAMDNREAKLEGLEAGAADFLSKPFDRQELLVRTRTLVDNKQTNDRLVRANQYIQEMAEYTEMVLKTIGPDEFDLEEPLMALVRILLRETHVTRDQPAWILLAFEEPDGSMRGYLYTKRAGTVLKVAPSVRIDPFPPADDPESAGELVVSNWDTAGPARAYYEKVLPERVKAAVGAMENFIVYRSAKVMVAAFNYPERATHYEAQVLKSLVLQSTFMRALSDQLVEVEQAFRYTIEALARAAEANDPDTGNHIARVNEYSRLLAEELGCPPEFVREISYSAQMHDVGKIQVSTSLLNKPDQLTRAEWEEIKRHTEYGARILGDEPRLRMARDIALEHHEQYSGNGYPLGLKGEAICLAARIVKFADVYDALRSKRAYKPAFDHREAVDIMLEGDSKVMPEHFDPTILEVFRKRSDLFGDIFSRFRQVLIK